MTTTHALKANSLGQRVKPPLAFWFGDFIRFPFELLELEWLKLMALGTLEMPDPLVSRPESRVHRITLGPGSRNQEPTGIPEGPSPLEHHLQPA